MFRHQFYSMVMSSHYEVPISSILSKTCMMHDNQPQNILWRMDLDADCYDIYPMP
jgi:hypothetical protein